MSARASGKRSVRGFGLPGYSVGVTVPTSNKAEAHRPQTIDATAALVQAGGQPTRLGKVMPASVTGSWTRGWGTRADQRWALHPRQRAHQ